MKRTFKEFPAFSRLVQDGEISDAQVARVQADIMSGGGRTMAGTGGVKKIRCEARTKGKSGGWRVFFADYGDQEVTFLIWAFPKSRQAALSATQRKAIRSLKQELDAEMGV